MACLSGSSQPTGGKIFSEKVDIRSYWPPPMLIVMWKHIYLLLLASSGFHRYWRDALPSINALHPAPSTPSFLSWPQKPSKELFLRHESYIGVSVGVWTNA